VEARKTIKGVRGMFPTSAIITPTMAVVAKNSTSRLRKTEIGFVNSVTNSHVSSVGELPQNRGSTWELVRMAWRETVTWRLR